MVFCTNIKERMRDIVSDPCKDCKDRPTQLQKLDAWIERAKSYSVVLIISVIVIGILIIFACGIFNKTIPGLSEMNQFVSIVLGVVATIVSIVSMLVSFYGLEKTEESERRQNATFREMIDIEKDTRRSAKAIEDSIKTGLKNPNVISRNIDSSVPGESAVCDADDI